MVCLFMREMQSNTGLGIPMPLTENIINTEVDNSVDWSSSSVFVLGGIRKGNDGKLRFKVRLVKHVDGDLGASLRKYIDMYSGFRFKFFRSTQNAYNRECQIYHAFNPRDNREHPEPPRNTKFFCPITSCSKGK